MACSTVLAADILKVFAALLYQWHICMLNGCIVFTFLFVSEAYIKAYNNVSSAVLIHRLPGVLPPQQCFLGLCIVSICELLSWPSELSSQQIS